MAMAMGGCKQAKVGGNIYHQLMVPAKKTSKKHPHGYFCFGVKSWRSAMACSFLRVQVQMA